MTKADALTYLKQLQTRDETAPDAVLPVCTREVDETLESLDTYREFQRDQYAERDHLTSDET